MATDVLRGALNTDVKSPVERFGGVLTGGSIRERGQAARQAMPTIMQESAQAAGQAKRAELEATSQQLGREAAAEEEAATKLRTETERIRGLEQPYQEFKAPEYTAADYAKGAAKRALVGVLLGGIAKTSAMTQLKAIKAMQDAERDGRTQDFEAARLNFDEAEKKRADFNKRLQTELSDFQQLLGKDTAAARLKAKMMTAQMMDGLASAAERNQNYKQFMEILTNATNQSNELEMEAFKQQGRLREAQAKEAAKGTTGGPAGIGEPEFRRGIQIHSSGIPLAPFNMYAGLDPRSAENLRRQELELAKPIRQKSVEEVSKAREIRSAMDVAQQSLDNIVKKGKPLTGGVYGLPGIGGIMQDVRTSKDPDASRFRTVAAQLQREAYVPGEGQISNFERQLFAQANLDLGRPMQTNYDLIEANRVAANRAIERAAFLDKYFALNRTLSGADELWEGYLNANPILMRNEKGEIVSNPNRAKSYEEYFGGMRGSSQRTAPSENTESTSSTSDSMELTADDVVEQAELNNISIEEAGRRLRARGYTIKE